MSCRTEENNRPSAHGQGVFVNTNEEGIVYNEAPVSLIADRKLSEIKM